MSHEFACDFIPPDVLRKRPGTEHADTIVTAPEGRIGDEDGSMWRDLWSRYDNGIELLAHPDMRTSVFLGKLFECLLALDVFLPDFNSDTVVSPR